MIRKWTKPWEEPEPEVKYVSSRMGRRPSLEPPNSPILGLEFKPCHRNDKYVGCSIPDLIDEITSLEDELNYQKKMLCDHLKRKIKGYGLPIQQIVDQMNRFSDDDKFSEDIVETILNYSDGIDYTKIKTLHDAVDLLHLRSQLNRSRD